MLTALTADSFKNMQINAGLFLRNFSYSTITDAAALLEALEDEIESRTNLLGATEGGGSFTVTPTMREIEADGKRNSFVGSKVLDAVDVKLAVAQLKETTPGALTAALGLGESATSGKKTTIKYHNEVKDADYIASLCWVGDLQDGRFVLINIYNALNAEGVTYTFADKAEGKFPVTFTAHQSGVSTSQYAPFEIVIFDKPDPTPGGGSSGT